MKPIRVRKGGCYDQFVHGSSGLLFVGCAKFGPKEGVKKFDNDSHETSCWGVWVGAGKGGLLSFRKGGEYKVVLGFV